MRFSEINSNKHLVETALAANNPKADLEAKRKALQDLERQPGVDLAAVRQRKLELEKEARAKGLTTDVAEEKVRLDPACWHNKKIGNPKTKMKGGVRVNNCVPKEGVTEGTVDHRALGKHHEEMTDQELRKVGSKLPDSWDAAVFRRKLASHPKYAQALKHYDKSEYHFGKAARQGVAEGLSVVGDTEQDQELRNYSQDTADRAREEIKNKLFNTLPKPSEDETVHEEDMNPEYDDEAGMAQGSLHTLKNAVQGLSEIIDAGDNLPEWCQEKISLAEDYLVTVWDYIQSEKAQGIDPEIEEMYEAMESLAEEMARKNRVSVDRVWESFEALDDHMLYETAAWRRKEGKNKNGGLNAKGVASYRRENPGSKLQTAVTTKPSKLKPGSKAAKRRKSFCARMSGVKGPMKKPNGKPTRKALALRKWNC